MGTETPNTVLSLHAATAPAGDAVLVSAVLRTESPAGPCFRVVSLSGALAGPSPLRAIDHCGPIGTRGTALAVDEVQRGQLAEQGFVAMGLPADRVESLTAYLQRLGLSDGDPLPEDAFLPAFDPTVPLARQALRVAHGRRAFT